MEVTKRILMKIHTNDQALVLTEWMRHKQPCEGVYFQRAKTEGYVGVKVQFNDLRTWLMLKALAERLEVAFFDADTLIPIPLEAFKPKEIV